MLVKKSNQAYLIVLILVLTYFLSFCKSCTNTDKREILKSALINPKYEKEINQFVLSNSQNIIELNKIDNLWIIKDYTTGQNIPADSKKIENFLQYFTKVQNMYKISDKISKNNSFGLLNSSSFTLKYKTSSGIYELYFGNQDFSLNSRYFTTDKNPKVYEIDDSINIFLSTSISSWADPYLISQEEMGKITTEDIQSIQFISQNNIKKIENYQKLLDLRHGGLPQINSDSLVQERILSKLLIELGNKNEINLCFYSTSNENEFIVKAEYISSGRKTEYYSCISSWTYNKIREITL